MSSDVHTHVTSPAGANVAVIAPGPAPHPSSACPVEAPGDIAVRLRDVGKCYRVYGSPSDRLKQWLLRGRKYGREFWALRGVDLEVARGETLGIVGRNGSGKSTLLQILCGTLAPTTGRVETVGRVAALLELGAGFHPEFTGRENVYLNARIRGLSRAQTDACFDDIAAFADIGAFIDQPVKTYSSGMYVRLAFSVIASIRADLLVIDEALAVGDAFFTQKCMRFLRGFHEDGGTIVFVSHDATAVLSLCRRAMWLDAGRVRAIGPAKSVNEAYLADLFGEISRQRAAQPKEPPPQTQSADVAGDTALDVETTAVRPVLDSCGSFGEGGARILGVDVIDDHGAILQIAQADQWVTVRVHVRALREIRRPIVGFYLKDRLGQNLFGQNTASAYGAQPPGMRAGEDRVAVFSFQMPRLQRGNYTLAAAVAEGTPDEHVQHHWIHDAWVLAASGRDATGTGLVGIAMRQVAFRTVLKPRGDAAALGERILDNE